MIESRKEKTMSELPEYVSRLPDAVPAGKVLVHNHVRPQGRLGMNGFRAWLSPAGTARLEVCDCGWAPKLGQHFRTIDRPTMA